MSKFNSYKIGTRVGAMMGKLPDGTIEFLGYGKYLGDKIPPDEIGGFNLGLPNPQIELDNGDIVWGCECWWGDAKKFKKLIKAAGDKVINVNIKDMRKKYVFMEMK